MSKFFISNTAIIALVFVIGIVVGLTVDAFPLAPFIGGFLVGGITAFWTLHVERSKDRLL